MQLVKQFPGGTVANIEKHQKQPMEQIEDAVHLGGRDNRGHPVILRLEDLPATPHNLERIRERVRLLNQRLAASGTPLRLRVA
jgi:hypothetical protein